MCAMMCRPQYPAVPTNARKCKMQNAKGKILHFKFLILNSNRGYTLLLAVVIMSAVVSAAALVARSVVREIRQTRTIANAIAARAQAEEQIEKAIFLLRHTELTLQQVSALLENTTVEPETRTLYLDIPENDFISLTIPEEVALEEIAPRIVRWSIADQNCASWIEVTSIGWTSDPGATEPFDTNRQAYSRASDFGPSGYLPVLFSALGRPVELRIKALYCGINELGVEGIPGRIRVTSTGASADTRQSIEMLIVRHPPAGGLLDFVVFSECSIIKGEPISPNCPSN